MKVYEQPMIETVFLSIPDVLSISTFGSGRDLGGGDIGVKTSDFGLLGGGL